jgi:hypothetical protein
MKTKYFQKIAGLWFLLTIVLLGYAQTIQHEETFFAPNENRKPGNRQPKNFKYILKECCVMLNCNKFLF